MSLFSYSLLPRMGTDVYQHFTIVVNGTVSRPPSSRATLHHLAPVVMVDGTKQGLFIGVRAQVDTSRAPSKL